MKRFMLVLAMAAGAAAASAATPEGKGSLDLGVGLGLGSTLEAAGPANYTGQTSYQGSLKGDMPIWSGIAAGLDLEGSNSPYTLTTSGINATENLANYGLGAELRLYPAAFASRAFKPGDNANPDGWLLWPSLTLRYELSKVNDFNTITPGSTEANIYYTQQDFGYEVTLPATEWLSARAGYLRNTEQDLDFTDFDGPRAKDQVGGIYEAESLGLSGFINLVPGAGADTDRAFVPHLGRVGQLRVDFDWKRQIDMPLVIQHVQGIQTYSLAVGAPLTRNLGLGLGVVHTEADAPQGGFWGLMIGHAPTEDRDTWQYGLNVSWAFGSAESRVDQ